MITPNLDLLKKLFIYDKWAIDLSLASIEKASNKIALSKLSHTINAEQIWLERLRGGDSSGIPVFRELSVDECSKLSGELYNQYTEFLNSLSEADLYDSITYKNTKGAEFSTSIRDILLHVAMHGTYHRGQIALLIREKGFEPADTDYISFTRI